MRLDDATSAALEWIRPRATEVLVLSIAVGGVSITAINTVAPDGTLANALASWGVLLAGALFMAAVVSNGSEGEPCDVCGHDVSEFPNYCAVCGNPVSEEEAESVIEAARAAARDEARQVAGEQ